MVLLTIIIGALAVCGVFLILQALFDAMLLPLPEKDACHVFFLRGDAGVAQKTVRACLRLREYRGMRGLLIFVDDGLDAEASVAVELLLRKQEGTRLCAVSQISEFWEKEKLGTGTD